MPPATANTSYIHLGSYYYEPIDGAFHLDELTPVEGISPRYPEQAEMTAYSGERIGLPLSFTPGNASRGQISWTSNNSNSMEVVYEGIDSCEVLLKQPGTATITATHNRVEGVSTSFTITVKPSEVWALDETKNVTFESQGCVAYQFTAEPGSYVIWNDCDAWPGMEVFAPNGEQIAGEGGFSVLSSLFRLRYVRARRRTVFCVKTTPDLSTSSIENGK